MTTAKDTGKPTVLEHPPIPRLAFEAATTEVVSCNAELHPACLPAGEAAVVAVMAAAKVLWREWTRGMAVVPLPEPDSKSFDGVPRWAGEVNGDVEAYVIEDQPAEPFVFYWGRDIPPTEAREIAGKLLAAADRAEQLAAEVNAEAVQS